MTDSIMTDSTGEGRRGRPPCHIRRRQAEEMLAICLLAVPVARSPTLDWQR